MTAENFCYWLQGKLEIDGDRTQMLTVEQVDIIKRHLSLVFKNVTAPPPVTLPDIRLPPSPNPWQGPWCSSGVTTGLDDTKTMAVC